MNTRYEPGPVTTISLDRAERKNCIDYATATELAGGFERFAADDEAMVLIVTGLGGAFCAGADLHDVEKLGAVTGRSGPLGFSAIDVGKPTIAAIEGPCVAGGLELAAWCDFRIAGEGAIFGAYNRRWGIPFTDGGTVRIPRIVGLGNAMALLLGGLTYSAEQMQRMGFVQEIVEQGEALSRAHVVADWMSTLPQASLRADRAAILAGFGSSLDDALDIESDLCRAVLPHAELSAGLDRFVGRERPTPPLAR